MKVLAPYLACAVFAGFEGDEVDEFKQALEQGYSMIYIMSPDGIWLHQVLSPGRDGKQRFIRLKVDKIPGAVPKKIEPCVAFLPDGKVPMALFHEVRAFFRAVISAKKGGNEAMIWVMWSQERGYFLHVPDQVVGPASARYDWTNLPPNSSIIIDIHSHADMNAFFSGTDDNDDRGSVRFSGVFGKNTSPKPVTVWRFNWQNVKKEVTVEDLFQDIEPLVPETPSEWLEKVKTHSETYRGHSGYAGGNYEGGDYPGYRGYQGRTIPNYGHGTGTASRHSFHPDSEAPQPGVQSNHGGTSTGSYVKTTAEKMAELEEKKKHFGVGNNRNEPSNSRSSSSNGTNGEPINHLGGRGLLERPRTTHEGVVRTRENVIHIDGKPFQVSDAGVILPSVAGKRYVDNGQYLEEVPEEFIQVETKKPTDVAQGYISSYQRALNGMYPNAKVLPDGTVVIDGVVNPELQLDLEGVLQKEATFRGSEEAEELIDAYVGASPENQSSALERMQERLRQEAILKDDEIREIIDGQRPGKGDSNEGTFEAGLVTTPKGAYVFITPDDYSLEHDEYAIEHGPQVAAAYSIITNLTDVISGSGEPLRKVVEDMFSAIPEEEQLAVFRTLYRYLPPAATNSLAQNGL